MLKVRLRVKLLGAFALVLALLVTVIGVYQYLSSHTTSSFKDLLQEEMAISRHAATGKAYELQCRRNEKDFLLRKDKKYLQKLSDNVASLKAEAQAIIGLAVNINEKESAATASAIIGYADKYETAFKDLVAAWEKKGLDHKSGLQGKFRAVAHELSTDIVEHQADSLQVALLMMRRYEKDFIRTGSDKYQQKLTTAILTYQELVRTSNCAKSSLLNQELALASYNDAFSKYLDAGPSIELQEKHYQIIDRKSVV